MSVSLLTSSQIESALTERPLFDVPPEDPEIFESIENPLSIDDITLILDKHCRINGPNGIETILDATTLALIDSHIDYKLFIIGGDIYTWENMYKYHPFMLMGMQPEAVTFRLFIDIKNENELFVSTIENKTDKAAPTKIYKAGAGWQDFMSMTKLYNFIAKKKQTDQKMLALGMPVNSGLLQLK
jgi:hypothetical protein